MCLGLGIAACRWNIGPGDVCFYNISFVWLVSDRYDYNVRNKVSYLKQCCWYHWCCQHYWCSPLCFWGWQGNWFMVVVRVLIVWVLCWFSITWILLLLWGSVRVRLFMCCRSSLSSSHFRLQILRTLLFVVGVGAGAGGGGKGRGGSSGVVWCLGNVCVVFSCFI